MDYTGLSWVEFIPLLSSIGLFIAAYFVCKEDWRLMWEYGDYFLMSFLSTVISLVASFPLIISLCLGCLVPNSPDDIQCAAVINASENVVFIEHDEELPETGALVVREDEGNFKFSVWKDNIMLFDCSYNRRRSYEACRLVKCRGQEAEDQTEHERQEIIKEILYENT